MPFVYRCEKCMKLFGASPSFGASVVKCCPHCGSEEFSLVSTNGPFVGKYAEVEKVE